MQHNILRESNITKIYMMYTDNRGLKKRYNIKLKFMDTQVCYFSTELPTGFEKPKRKTPALINVYTPDGIYSTNLQIFDTVVSMNDVMFEVNIPKVWDFKQLRSSSRKLVELPVNIKFNDGFEIAATTYDISLGGISFFYSGSFSGIYKRIPCIMTIEFPNDLIINFPDCKLVTEGKFVREQNKVEDVYVDGTLYAFNFIKLEQEEQEILKSYLLKLE